MNYYIKNIKARCVGSFTYSKEYTNNGIKKTYVNKFVNLVFDDPDNPALSGYNVGSYKLKTDIDDIVDSMYDIDLMVLVSDDNKRSYSVSRMVRIKEK